MFALVLFFGHGVTLGIRRRREAPMFERGRRILLESLDRPAPPDDIEYLSKLPVEIQFRLFEEVGPSLRGVALLRIRELATGTRLLERAKASTRSRWWWVRLRGARAHTLLGGGRDTMPRLLDDRIPEVRAQAAEWASEHPSPAIIRKLLDLLADKKRVARFTVQDSLIKLGGAVTPQLAAYLLTDAEGLADALEVARYSPDIRYIPGAEKLTRHTDPEVRRRAALVLGAIGGQQVTTRLRELVTDPEPAVRAAAIDSLGRAGHWPAAPDIADALADPAWDVRRAAGLALKSFGPPGALFLRKALSHTDRFAADMARHVMGLPGRAASPGARA